MPCLLLTNTVEMIKPYNSKVFFVLLMLFSLHSYANDATLLYIEQYKTIAINEMQRVQIPASIKMAQAILESNSGRSTLARQSNNHFGIKCGSKWDGPEVYREDDDYENGLLIRSCFRAFSDPSESFYEHSDFLANPYSKRYRFLFELDIYDYKSWARGLKKAGYATDPKYPQKLINVIEKYRLYELDLGIISVEELAQREQTRENTREEEDQTDDVIIITAQPSATAIASNGSNSNRNTNRKTGYHRVAKSESMEIIAQKYGIDIKKLYMQNRMPFGVQPKQGEDIALNHFIHFKQTPDWIKPNDSRSDEPEFLFEETITIAANE